MAQKTAAHAAGGQQSLRRQFQQRVERYPEIGAFIGFLVVFIGFAIFASKFLTLKNWASVMSVAAELGILSVGVTLLMISGEFDLSVGSVIGVAAMTMATLTSEGVPQFPVFIIAMVFCALIGWTNATIVIRGRIPSFIVTLGTMMFWRGVLFAITGGFPISWRGDQTLLMWIFNGRFGAAGFFMSAWWFLLIVIVGTVALTQTKYGNATYATGGDQAAARALGINVNRTKTINFMICSMLAGFMGVIQFSRFSSVAPGQGQGMELEAIAASVIGGSLLTGGRGSIVGTLLGALLVGMMRSGLVLAGAPVYWYKAFIGLILIAAVLVNARVRGK